MTTLVEILKNYYGPYMARTTAPWLPIQSQPGPYLVRTVVAWSVVGFWIALRTVSAESVSLRGEALNAQLLQHLLAALNARGGGPGGNKTDVAGRQLI